MKTAESWAIEAARYPLAFSQVREDPRVDLEVLQRLKDGRRVVMIASGGETAVQMLNAGVDELHLVDLNPAQLALTRLKLHLSGAESPGRSLAILGHEPLEPEERQVGLDQLLRTLGLPGDIFGPADVVARCGPDYVGRYEWTFHELREKLLPIHQSIEAALGQNVASAITRLTDLESSEGAILSSAFEQAMSLENLVCLFGTGATQNPRQAFSKHFCERTQDALKRRGANENPFLWQVLTGRFPAGHPYDCWLPNRTRSSSDRRISPVFHESTMNDALFSMDSSSADLIHLSNICDWLNADEAALTLSQASRVLRPGGWVILRQLNSSLSIDSIPAGIEWDTGWGNRLEAGDRSYFYPKIYVGTRL
jgi:S-adenosylmethionine-diacylglycerol 3-amino-3-carboxypropyl transferase